MSQPTPHSYRDLLLDRLDETSRCELERMILGSESHFQAALAEEAELSDAYVRGELAAEERAAFERGITRSERLRRRVALAYELQRLEGSPNAGASSSWNRAWAGLLAASVAAAAVSVVLWLQLTPSAPDDPSRISTVSLYADVLRGAEQLPTHHLRSGTDWIRLELELLDPEASGPFELTLFGPAGEDLWGRDGLEPSELDWGRAVIAERPRRGLPTGPLRAELRNDRGELVGYYEFELRSGPPDPRGR